MVDALSHIDEAHEHIAKFLNDRDDNRGDTPEAQTELLAAIAHALISIAITAHQEPRP